MSNQPLQEKKDPREVLRNLRQKVLQKALENKSDHSLLKDQRDREPVTQPPYPYEDPLTRLYRLVHEQWQAFSQQVEETHFRSKDDQMRQQLREQLVHLNESYDPLQIMEAEEPVRKSLKSRFNRFLKKGLLSLLKPILLRQQTVNSNMVRFCNTLMETMDAENHHQRYYNDQVIKLGERLLLVVNALQEARDRMKRQWDVQYSLSDETMKSAFDDIFEDLSNLRRDINSTQRSWEVRNHERMMALHSSILTHKELINSFLQKLAEQQDNVTVKSEERDDLIGLIAQRDTLFEDEYRGSSADIRARQMMYLPHFEGKAPIIDLGCGRGEFLELLREKGIMGTGVETNPDLITICQEKQLHVVRKDAIEFLADQADESVEGIFCAQVIEHLPPKLRISLLNLAFRKLKPECTLIVETVNPLSVYALSQSYFADQSHQPPVHPEAIHFIAQSCGFKNVEIRFLHPVPEEKLLQKVNPDEIKCQPKIAPLITALNNNVGKLNSLLFGYQDYALIANK